MAATTLSVSRRTSFEQRLPGFTSIAVVVPAVAGLGIRKTGCIAKSISPVRSKVGKHAHRILSANDERVRIEPTPSQ